MKAKEMAQQMIEKFSRLDGYNDSIDLSTCPEAFQAALLAVSYIISANPHENPPTKLNSKSTVFYWISVKIEILKIQKEFFCKYLNDVKL